MSSGPWERLNPIPEMDTSILDFHSKAGTVNWTNEDSVVNYLIQGAELMSGKKQFDKQRSEKLQELSSIEPTIISMFNHAALQGGEEYWNRLNEIKQPTLIIHGTDDKIWHYKNAGFLLEK